MLFRISFYAMSGCWKKKIVHLDLVIATCWCIWIYYSDWRSGLWMSYKASHAKKRKLIRWNDAKTTDFHPVLVLAVNVYFTLTLQVKVQEQRSGQNKEILHISHWHFKSFFSACIQHNRFYVFWEMEQIFSGRKQQRDNACQIWILQKHNPKSGLQGKRAKRLREVNCLPAHFNQINQFQWHLCHPGSLPTGYISMLRRQLRRWSSKHPFFTRFETPREHSPSQCPLKSCSTLLPSHGSPPGSSFFCHLLTCPFSRVGLKRASSQPKVLMISFPYCAT